MSNQENKTKGIFFILCAALCFALMNLFVKLSGDLPPIQKTFFRNGIAFWVALYIILKKKPEVNFNKTISTSLFMRSLFGTLGIICNFYAVDKLLFADATMLNKMSPFFTVIFSFFILKEKVKFPQLMIILGAFMGMLIAIRPSFHNINFIPSAIGFFGGVSAGVAYSYVRKLGNNHVDSSLIILCFTSFSLITTLPLIIMNFQPMELKEVIILIVSGFFGTGGQFAVTKAYTYASAREISVYDYSQIVFAGILGLIFFRQIPDKYSLLGYSIIIGMAIVMYLYNNKWSTKAYSK